MKYNSGYLLIESIVAITVLTVGFLSVFSLVSQSMGLGRIISDEFTANYLAAEGIEIVKNLIDANYLQGNPWGGFSDGNYEVDYNSVSLEGNQSRFLLLNSNGYYSYQSGSEFPFKRIINITNDTNGKYIKVISTVRWKGRGGIDLEINLEDYFFNNR